MRLCLERGARQRLRLSVPPREEPAGGPPAARQLRAPARMIVYPAIDLRGGRCVRLLEGAFERETVYGDDPVAVARGFGAAGAGRLPVVGLDGARAGRPVQADLVAAICAAVRIPVQVGGGLRDAAAVDAALAAGATRAVLRTVAGQNPERAAPVRPAPPRPGAPGPAPRGGPPRARCRRRA